MDGHRTAVYALKHHPNETWNFLSGGWDDTVQFWDRRQERATKRIFGPHICGESIDIDPNDQTILVKDKNNDHPLIDIFRHLLGADMMESKSGTTEKEPFAKPFSVI